MKPTEYRSRHISTSGLTQWSLKLAQPKSTGQWLKISQIFQITVTEFNTNSLTATDSEADLLQKSPFFHFRVAEKVTQSYTDKVNGIYINRYINSSFENLQVNSNEPYCEFQKWKRK